MNTHNSLKIVAFACLAFAAAAVVLGETGALHNGVLAGRQPIEFVVQLVMSVLTLLAVPVALRLMQTRIVRRKLRVRTDSYGRMALLRWLLLWVPMMADVVCYYLFMKVAFAYLGIILLLAMVFVFPTQQRWNNETKQQDE